MAEIPKAERRRWKLERKVKDLMRTVVELRQEVAQINRPSISLSKSQPQPKIPEHFTSNPKLVNYQGTTDEVLRMHLAPLRRRAQQDVCIEFEERRFCFPIDRTTTFTQLAEQASVIWGLSRFDVFFSMSPFEVGAVFAPASNVFDELIPWTDVTCQNWVPTLYVILSNHDSSAKKMNLSLSWEKEPSSRPLETEIVEDHQQEVSGSSRDPVRRAFKGFFAETTVFLVVCALYMYSLYVDQNVSDISWMNQTNHRLFFTELDKYQGILQFEPRNQSHYLRVHTREKYFMFLDHLSQTVVFGDSKGEGLGHNQLYYNLQIRQQQSESMSCPEDFVNYTCVTKLSRGEHTEEYRSFEYSTEEHHVVIEGMIDTYSLNGFAEELSVSSEEEWNKTRELIETNNWINRNTRMIALTTSIINFNVNAMSILINLMEIDSNGMFIPNYLIYSFHLGSSQASFLTVHVLLFGVLLLALCFMILNGLIPRDEWQAFLKTPWQLREAAPDVPHYHATPCWQRFHFQTKLEPFKFLVIGLALICEVVFIVFVLTAFNALDTTQEKYVSTLFQVRCAITFNEVRVVIMWFLLIVLSVYLASWFETLRRYSSALTEAYKEHWWPLTVYFLMLLVLSWCMHLLIGCYSYVFSLPSSSFYSTVGLFAGNWYGDVGFIQAYNDSSLAFFLLVIKFCKMIVLFMIVCSIYLKCYDMLVQRTKRAKIHPQGKHLVRPYMS